MAKECMLSTGKLPLGGFPRKSVVKITGRPDMNSAVYSGRKVSIQTNNTEILYQRMKFFFKNLNNVVKFLNL